MASAVGVAAVATECGTQGRSGLERSRSLGAAWCALLSVAVFVLGGYHPFAEDGGLYLAGVRWQMDPSLYRGSVGFVTAHLRYSAFAPVVAGLTRVSGAGSLETVVLGLYLLSVWGTLGAGWLVARQVFGQWREWMGATAVLAAGLAVPVAGTSLVVADPYLTARSFSTIGCLLGLAAALRWLGGRGERGRWRWLVSGATALGGAAVFHPLMAGYGAVCSGMVLAVGLVRDRRWLWVGVWGALGGVTLCGVVLACAAKESGAARAAALTRTYWFLGQWQWYEVAGLWAPAGLLLWLGHGVRRPSGLWALCRGVILAGGVAVLMALLFARVTMSSLAVARLQPLRLFQTVYAVMFLVLGGLLARVLRRNRIAIAVAAVLLTGVSAGCGWAAAADLPHLEVPWSRQQSAWVRAFVWARENTPRDALFALDADYIGAPGEGAESFRAVAERASLPDAAKDGGEAAITPELARAWVAGVRAQEGLSAETDAERRQRLVPMGVTWLVLRGGAETALPCPYRNAWVKVCQLGKKGG